MLQTQVRLNNYWNSRAAAYHHNQVVGKRAQLEYDIWQSRLRTVLDGGPHNVLDVGTGTGYVAQMLANVGHRVTGLDASPGLLEEARREAARHRRAPRYALGDAVAPAAAPESVDAITNRYLVWTLREPHLAFANWFRILRPGGRLIVIDAHHFPTGLETITTVESSAGADAFVRTYSAEVQHQLPLSSSQDLQEYRWLFDAAGFTDVTVQHVPELLELSQTFGVAAGHHPIVPFIMTGHKPAHPLGR